MRERLTHVQVKGEKKIEIEEMMESYVVLCEKATSTRNREDLPKIFLTKLDEQKRETQHNALAKACSPPKTAAETAHTPSTTRTSRSTSTIVMISVPTGKEKGSEQRKKKEKQFDVEEVVPIESDVESNWALLMHEPVEEAAKESAATEKQCSRQAHTRA